MNNATTSIDSLNLEALADESVRPSDAVITAVADASGKSPLDVNPPLYSAIDADALNDVIASLGDDTGATVSFNYAGFAVTVGADGDVSVSEESAVA